MKSATKRIWGAGLILTVAGVIGASVYDCRAPTISFTYRDLAVPDEVARSYDTLMRYRENGTNQLDIALPDPVLQLAATWTSLLPYAETIGTAWSGCIEGRKYIQDLDQFDYITDWNNPQGQSNPSRYASPDYETLRKITLLYALHSTLLIQQGRTEEGLRELTQHYSVIRKSLPYATTLITFAINMSCAKLDLQQADLLVRNTEWSPAQLQELRNAFARLTQEELSWYRPLLAEYIYSQHMVTMIRSENTELDSELMYNLSRFKYATFKPNLTLQSFKQIYEPLINLCVQRQDLQPKLAEVRHAAVRGSILGKVWNPSGQALIAMMVPVWDNVYSKTLELKTASDLLYLEIESRLGELPDLRDAYTGAAYRYNPELQRFYCVGPDGLDATGDDLYINPPDA